MFDSTYYITDVITGYTSSGATHSVAWIENNYDDYVQGGYDLEYTSASIPKPADEFSLSNIYLVFKVSDLEYPYPTPWCDDFSIDNIYKCFLCDGVNYPYTQTVQSIDYSGFFSQYNIKIDGYPYPATVEWLSNFNANNVYSTFQIGENGFPSPLVGWCEPFSETGIFSVFKLKSNYYHNFPTPIIIDWSSYLDNKSVLNIAPDLIDKQITIYGEKTIILQKERKIISTQHVENQIIDRDKNKEDYYTYITKCWEERQGG